MKNKFKDLIVVVLSVVVIIASLSWVASNLSSKTLEMCPIIAMKIKQGLNSNGKYKVDDVRQLMVVPMVVPVITAFRDKIKWYDIFFLIIAWTAGVFFNKYLHRLVNRVYKDTPRD